MRVLLLLVALFCLAGPAAGQARVGEKEFLEWSTYYYRDPEPQRSRPMLQYAAKKGYLKDPYARMLLAVFLGRVAADDPLQLGAWAGAVSDASDAEQEVLLRAIWFSRHPSAAETLRGLVGKTSDEHKALLDLLLKEEAPAVEQMPVESADVLDMLWSCYMATGDVKYVRRIIGALAYRGSADRKRVVVAAAAKWSLTSNCAMHPQVMKECVAESRNLDGIVSTALKEIVEKARLKRGTTGRGKR